MKAFRVKDLMINVVPQAIGKGGVGHPGPDDDIDDFPPTITPIIMVAKFSPRIRVIDQFAGKVEQLDLHILDTLALDAGRAAVAGMFVGTALCTEDMPTCRANPRISPVASMTDGLRFEDLVQVKDLLNQALERINRLEESRLALGRRNARGLVPMLESAAAELRGKRKS